jgi:hypothetical protein
MVFASRQEYRRDLTTLAHLFRSEMRKVCGKAKIVLDTKTGDSTSGRDEASKKAFE